MEEKQTEPSVMPADQKKIGYMFGDGNTYRSLEEAAEAGLDIEPGNYTEIDLGLIFGAVRDEAAALGRKGWDERYVEGTFSLIIEDVSAKALKEKTADKHKE